MVSNEVDTQLNGPSSSLEQEPRPKEVIRTAEEEHDDNLMCRVCRGNDGHLYYPCLCTGSIKYVHQECLTEWLKYSKKEVCELCSYKYSFQPIYRPDMPKALPVKDIIKGLVLNALRFFKTWILYSLVMVAWLGVVPLITARIYNTVFYASFTDVLLIPAFMFKTDNVVADIVKGSFLLVLFVCTFISLVWLREQIIHGGPQDFINIPNGPVVLEEEQPMEEEDDDDSSSEGYEPEGEYVEEEVRDNPQEFDMARLGIVVHRDRAGFVIDEPLPEHQQNQVMARGNNAEQQPEVEQAEENWRDWDRLGDELTWQRLLGLDGSFIFLEHVLWVISLNTLFTLLFAYTPYRLGHWILSYIGIQQSIVYFPSLAAILGGYFSLSCIIYSIHFVAGCLRWKLLFRLLGICFLVLKVFLLVVLEICLFPMICGYWIDLCSLSMFSATLSSRIASFASSPTASLFIHWMTGMVFVFYSASFVILLREVLRPGVLWFMRNLNDPDFNPIQEMIELPVQRHMQRIVTSTLLFFSTVFLVIFVPLTIIRLVMPRTLPFHMSVTAETPLSELSLELLILQIILPALLDQTQARTFIKVAVRIWCEQVGKLLDLESYLLPETPLVAPQDNAAGAANPAQAQAAAEEAGGGLAAEHQALLLIREPQPSSRPYVKPAWFGLRIAISTVLLAITWTICSTIFFIVPVNVGRIVVFLCTGLTQVHELYTTAIGLYVIYMTSQSVVMTIHWFDNGFDHMKRIVYSYIHLGLRILLLALPVVGLVPWMMGRYFQLIFVTPLRISEQQTALQFHLHDWAMGVLHLKIFVALVMLGPDWWLKRNLERIYLDGVPNLNATRILVQTVLPLLLSIGSLIAAPYIIARAYILVTAASFERAVLLYRIVYPSSVIVIGTAAFIRWQYSNLKALAEHIRNEKYLVGTQLVNYERRQEAAAAAIEAKKEVINQ